MFKRFLATTVALTLTLGSMGSFAYTNKPLDEGTVSYINSTLLAADKPSKWAMDFVASVGTEGILKAEMFKGFTTDINRKDFAYLSGRLYEELTGKTLEMGENPFTDTSDEWVIKGYNAGLLSGYGNGLYGPSDRVTREQISVLLVNMLRASRITLENRVEKFADDSEISDWAKEAVYLARHNEILSGVGNNKMNPKAGATREQAITLFAKILSRYTDFTVREGFSEKVTDSGTMVEEGYRMVDGFMISTDERSNVQDFPGGGWMVGSRHEVPREEALDEWIKVASQFKGNLIPEKAYEEMIKAVKASHQYWVIDQLYGKEWIPYRDELHFMITPKIIVKYANDGQNFNMMNMDAPWTEESFLYVSDKNTNYGGITMISLLDPENPKIYNEMSSLEKQQEWLETYGKYDGWM